LELADSGTFLEKNAHFDRCGAPVGGQRYLAANRLNWDSDQNRANPARQMLANLNMIHPIANIDSKEGQTLTDFRVLSIW
jgi:hypothetical protein